MQVAICYSHISLIDKTLSNRPNMRELCANTCNTHSNHTLPKTLVGVCKSM